MRDLIKMPTDNTPQDTPKKTVLSKKEQPKKSNTLQKMTKKYGLTASIILFVVLLAACLFLLRDAINVGAEALANSYSAAYESEKEAAYQELYQSAYERAEAKYHLSSKVLISIDSFEETEKLEVLEANHVEFITKNRDESTDNITAWIEVTGKGKFVVDLKAAEFIVDNEHRYVLVRIPYPELTDITITNAVEKLFKDDIWNGSYSDGVHLAIDQLNDADVRIKKALMSNQYIYKNAQNVAVSMITNLVKELNPDIPDLIVEVEFMD